MKYVKGRIETKIRAKASEEGRSILTSSEHRKIIEEVERLRPLQLQKAATRPFFRRETTEQRMARRDAKGLLKELNKNNRNRFIRRSVQFSLFMVLLALLVTAFRGLSNSELGVWFCALMAGWFVGWLLELTVRE